MGRYEVNLPDFDMNDWEEYEAFDAKDAAKKYAEYYDTDDSLLLDRPEYVRVKNIETGKIEIYEISAEVSISRFATKVTSLSCQECKKNMIEDMKAGDYHYSGCDYFCSQECFKKYYTVPQG